MKLLTENIWDTITRSVKKRKLNYVAVAYFGSDGANLLPLKKGDILVVDASEKTVRNGSTDPKALHILLDKGVRIYSKERLHAKVMVLGDTVFVGSTNVSTNSKYLLHEAVINSNEPDIVQQCKNYILNLPKKELDGKQLKSLLEIYSPPKEFLGKKKYRVANSQFRLFPLEIHRSGFSEGITEFLKQGKKKAIEEISSDEKLEVIEVDLDETTASLEFILQVENRKNDYFIYPPSEVIHKEIISNKNIAIIFLASKKGERGVSKLKFEKRLGRELPLNYWLSEAFSKQIMEFWKMTFN